ncbi:MAG: hypothetical protein PHN89_05655, partial [Candidatus Pacebacteria bacterium]|nr:hypothetical protein [Candidatus Paceibacterota bacterium]
MVHQKMTDKIRTKIRMALKEYNKEEIIGAIEKYATVINNPGYFWTYKWTLPDFLQRGLLRFKDTPIENFKTKTFDKPKKVKLSYRGEQVIESRGKMWVIHKG